MPSAGTSHGRDGVTYRLNKLIEAGAAIDDRGKPVANVADTRSAARDWGQSLRSQAWRAVAREQPANDLALGMLARLIMAQTVGSILHTIGTRVDHLTKEHDDMAITSEKMVKDLRLINEAVSRTGDLLEGQTRQHFQEASARYLETLANRIDLRRVQESGVEMMTRAEIEAIAGPNADRLIAHAQQIQGRETREAATAERLADRTLEAERRQEARAGADPDAVRELRAERAMVSTSEQAAARGSREAVAESEAVRALAAYPGRPLPADLGQTDALAKLRAEQERVIREIEAEAGEAESAKQQRMS